MKLLRTTILVTAVLFAACAPKETPEQNTEPDPSSGKTDSQVQQPIRETRNVTYTGTVRPAGISVYQQGSHRLMLESGKFILLESKTVDLNGYVNEEVRATGTVTPTVEEGGMLMVVENISLLNKKPEEPNTETTSEEEEPNTEDDDTTPEETASEDNKENPVVDEDDKEDEVVKEDDKEDEKEEPVLSAELEAIIQAMAQDDYAPERWSQPKYCTGHIGFCIPIHKNWWFKSFGNTTSHLWHVELSNAEINSIGDGPILVSLVSGSIESETESDKEVRIKGDKVIGFRAWDANSHFEIVADNRLENPVRFLTQELRIYEQ